MNILDKYIYFMSNRSAVQNEVILMKYKYKVQYHIFISCKD
jgi:hypothetical protein